MSFLLFFYETLLLFRTKSDSIIMVLVIDKFFIQIKLNSINKKRCIIMSKEISLNYENLNPIFEEI